MLNTKHSGFRNANLEGSIIYDNKRGATLAPLLIGNAKLQYKNFAKIKGMYHHTS